MTALLAVLALSPLAAGQDRPAPDAVQLQAAWDRWAPVLAAGARQPVTLSTAELSEVADGDVARRRDRLDGTDRVVGAIWTDQPRDAVWIAILDDSCDTIAPGLTELQLAPEQPHQKLLFQHLRLPWPFSDRQWLIDIRNNDGLHASTDGGAWERHWTLAADQERLRETVPDPAFPTPSGIWTPVNEGGWLLLDAAGGTLVVYHARADIGGVIPDDAATRWALGTLRGVLTHVLERADEIPVHYDADHAAIQRPDGSAIAPLR